MAATLTPTWRFQYDGLAGYISGGRCHGVELTAGAGIKPVTRNMCMNLEHYYTKACSTGFFVPRKKAHADCERLDDRTVRVKISPFEDWQLEATITYTLMPERIIEACFEFSFDADYSDFEAFISNYFHDPGEPYVHVGGEWIRPQLGDREHRYWARSDRDAEVIQDGRHDAFAASMKDYAMVVAPTRYDYPVMITPIEDSGWSVVHVAAPEMCPSISANRTWNAHDFSLIGHDVSKGQQVSCRAWMAYAELESTDDALKLYERLV